jgi:SAM-dependent methyltransferase
VDLPDDPPSWQLPPGVNASLWTYARSARLAETEESYFRDHPLFTTDARLILERFSPPGRLVDLGCGAGRQAIPLARHGFQVTGVELSHPMLVQLAKDAADTRVDCLRANLCRLGCIPDRTFDYAISLFSTLGMIRGVGPRQRALDESHRILKPGGRLAIHVHNVFLNLRDRQGRGWLLGQFPRILLGHDDAGDRRMTYRGIPNMEVHLYRWSELRRSLRRAGYRIDEVIPLNEVTARPISSPGFLHPLRAGGWVVFASRPR